MKTLFILGTKPEAIKLTPLIILFKKNNIDFKICSTNQQKDISSKVFDNFNIKIDYILDFKNINKNLTELTGEILLELNKIKDKYDLVIVHGDTTSSFCGALYSFYNKIPIAHVEAGLRSNNLNSPFPEEVNRKFIDIISSFHFVPNKNNKKSLLSEGVNKKNIYVTGNTVVDMLRLTIKKNYKHPIIDWVGDSKLIVCTLHRRENWDKIKSFIGNISSFLKLNSNFKVLYITNSNPHLKRIYDSFSNSQILYSEPLNVVDFHNILNKCYAIITDSGGLQEESSVLCKPIMVMRESTERQELINSSCGVIINKNFDQKNLDLFFNNINLFKKNKELYGKGDSCKKILKVLKRLNI